MKALNILKYYYPSTGGTETYVKQLCGGMHKYGIEPSILTFNHIPRIKTAWGKVDDIAVRRVACHLKLFSQPVGLLAAEMKQLIPKADLVHLHLPFPNAEFLYKYISKPLVVTWCVDPVNTRWEKIFPVFRPSLIQVLEKARKIVLIGPNLLEHSPTLQPYEKKCKVIPLACSPVKGHEPVPTVRRVNKERPAILFVGKLRKYKGVEYLIRSVQHLPDVQLRIVGDGEELSNLRQLTKKTGIDSRVIFLKTVTDEQLSFEYKNANLFVLPSIDASEAFGIVQLEAMSYGLPVINTALPSSVPFVSLDGVTGITVPHSDPPALSAAIKRLFGDHSFYENCSRNAIERAKLFSEENMIKKHSEVYRECV
jgi:rhamnosyl/mannosyltransferase